MLIADSCNCDAFSGLTARLILKVKSDDSGNTVYATVVGECGRNAWLPVVVAFMQKGYTDLATVQETCNMLDQERHSRGDGAS